MYVLLNFDIGGNWYYCKKQGNVNHMVIAYPFKSFVQFSPEKKKMSMLLAV